jgi:hypothetical protein
MELVKKIINDNEYTFVNKTWETSNSWGHETTLFKRHYEIGHNKVRYYNRTWESYRYQTCMRGCVYELISKRENKLKNYFKNEKNITRLTKKYEEEFEKYLENDKELKELKELKESL